VTPREVYCLDSDVFWRRVRPGSTAHFRKGIVPSTPCQLVRLRAVPQHRPVTLRRVLDLRAQRMLPVRRLAGGRDLFVDLADVDALFELEPALRGPLSERS